MAARSRCAPKGSAMVGERASSPSASHERRGEAMFGSSTVQDQVVCVRGGGARRERDSFGNQKSSQKRGDEHCGFCIGKQIVGD